MDASPCCTLAGVFAAARVVFDWSAWCVLLEQLRSSRIFAHVAGTEFWFAELVGYIFADLMFMVGMGPNMGNYWPMVSQLRPTHRITPKFVISLSSSVCYASAGLPPPGDHRCLRCCLHETVRSAVS